MQLLEEFLFIIYMGFGNLYIAVKSLTDAHVLSFKLTSSKTQLM